jgi:hypothetical protein
MRAGDDPFPEIFTRDLYVGWGRSTAARGGAEARPERHAGRVIPSLVGARIRGLVALWIVAAACRGSAVERPDAARASAPPIVAIAPPQAPAAPPARPRFVTPANPDVAPLPPVITRVTGKPVRRDLGGGWTVTLEPAEIAAAPGDEVEFSIEFRNRKPGSGRPELHNTSIALRWPDIAQRDRDDPSQWLPLQGGRTRGVLLASPGDWSYGFGIDLEFRQRQRPGSLGYARTDGPRLVLDTTSLVPVQVRQRYDRCDLPDGLAVTVEDRRVTVYFAKAMSSFDYLRPRGEFVVRRSSGRLTLVGFVEVNYSDFVHYRPEGPGCPELQTTLSGDRWMFAIEAQFTAPEAGPIDVVIHASDTSRRHRHVTTVLVE